VTNDRISVGEVKGLGGGRFSVQLTVEAPEGAISQTQTVLADNRDAAVQLAKDAFSRWLKKVTEYAVKNMSTNIRN
jgi:hypothetical protein